MPKKAKKEDVRMKESEDESEDEAKKAKKEDEAEDMKKKPTRMVGGKLVKEDEDEDVHKESEDEDESEDAMKRKAHKAKLLTEDELDPELREVLSDARRREPKKVQKESEDEDSDDEDEDDEEEDEEEEESEDKPAYDGKAKKRKKEAKKGAGELNPEQSESQGASSGTITPGFDTPSKPQNVFVPSSSVSVSREQVTPMGKSVEPDLMKSPMFLAIHKQLDGIQDTTNKKLDSIEKSVNDRLANLKKSIDAVEAFYKQSFYKAAGDNNGPEGVSSIKQRMEDGKLKYSE